MGHVRGLRWDDVLQLLGVLVVIVGLFVVFSTGVALIFTGLLLAALVEIFAAKGRP